jgi:hypothetical protein
VLSQPDGTYAIRDASADVAFFHSATAADLNHDGRIDVVVTNHPYSPAILLIGDGTGRFARSAAFALPPSIAGMAQYYTVELIDVDEDGDGDLLLGGHEWPDAGNAGTLLLLNPGDNDFSQAQVITLPPVANEGVVLDFTVTGSGTHRRLWVLRTSGGDGTFYQSRVIQKITWPSLASEVVLKQRPAQWIPWLIPAVVNGQRVISSDDASNGVSIPY